MNAPLNIHGHTQYQWYHSVDMGHGQVTDGRFPNNYTLFPVYHLLHQLDWNRARCADVGCMDGIIAATLKRGGAKTVVATDLWDRPSTRHVMAQLDIDIDYRPGVALNELAADDSIEPFELMVVAGVLYHVIDPFAALLDCRRLLRPQGYLIIETAIAPGDEPNMCFNLGCRATPYDEPTTFWLPTQRCVDEMLYGASLEPICRVSHRGRYAVLAQAVPPTQAEGAAPWATVTQGFMAEPVWRRWFSLPPTSPQQHVAHKAPRHRHYEIREPTVAERQAQFTKAVYQAHEAGCRRLALYGGGADTQSIAPFLNSARLRDLNVEFVAIIDDGLAKGQKEWQAPGTERALPLHPLAGLNDLAVDGLLLTSYRYQAAMMRKIKDWSGKVFSLYTPMWLPELEPTPNEYHPVAWPVQQLL